MARQDLVESMARQLVSLVLRDPCWQDNLEPLCASLHADARRATPRQTMMAVASRAETVLRHIARADAVAVGRLYFDLLPGRGNPLTEKVIEALSRPEGALELLRDSGFSPSLKKDGNGVTVIEIEIPDHSTEVCDATRDAIIESMGDGWGSASPLHTLH
ncbi:hypothetical protein [Magnetospirillum sp. 64-120]|uniref:hypothetical protein n=1 Tax=Magnetospirillum sp. 64-120 TaxID=1895778 RepID=UPI00092C2091|nr:hypothetical protein [Magnetospirillum sp. 64-120]OJX80018.1 MAG: hypothetical protein BGO92_03680 [Magnetospirillum sp. 64-120]